MQTTKLPTMPMIKERLKTIALQANPAASIAEVAEKAIPEKLIEEYSKLEGARLAHGKVRDLVVGTDKILMYNSDRLSAFDCFVGLVPFRGVILAHLSEFWLQRASKLVPTNSFERVTDRSFLVERCKPIPVEIVLRSYLVGAILRAYKDGKRVFCGQKLPEGLKPYQKLPTPIITPTTKAEAFEHDEETTAKEVISQGICSAEEWSLIESYAFKLFSDGETHAKNCGWILVDTKYEFGRDQTGTIKLIDELHTPDSSRFWEQSSYKERLSRDEQPKMFDKQIVRQWLEEQGFSGHGKMPAVPEKILLELATAYADIAASLSRQ